MLTFGTALLHIGATILGGLSSAIAVEMWHERRKAAPTPVTSRTAGVAGAPPGARGGRRAPAVAGAPAARGAMGARGAPIRRGAPVVEGTQARQGAPVAAGVPAVRRPAIVVEGTAATERAIPTRGTPGAPRQLTRTGAVDPFVALRRVVEAVPFYGPPAAAALDVAQEAVVVPHRSQQAKKQAPSKRKRGEAGSKEPKDGEERPQDEQTGSKEPRGGEARAKDGEAKARESDATPKDGETATPLQGGEKKQGPREEKAENKAMIMSDKASAKTVAEPPRALSTIVAGLAAADEELGAAMAPVPPPVDYLVRGRDGKRRISRDRYRRWRQRFDDYRRELEAYNSARAFDKQIERQKQEIREQIRRAGSNNDVEALRRDLRQVESMGRLSTRPRLFMNIDQDARLAALVRGVLSGQRPQVSNPQAFETLIQSFLALAQAQAQAAPTPADPFAFPPQAQQVPQPSAAPFAAPPPVAPAPGPAAPFTMPQGPAVAPAPLAPAVPVVPAPVVAPPAVMPSPAAPFALPPDQPYAAPAAPPYMPPNMPPAQPWAQQGGLMDPRLAPMDEDYSGLQSLTDDGFGVVELEGACQCGGSCGKCRADVGCASCAIGDYDDDDEIETSAGPQDIDDEDDLEGYFGDDELEGGFDDDDLEGDEDDLEGFDDELEGGFGDDDLEGDDELEGDDDDLEGDDDLDEDE